jgi:hypothetical protein
LGFLLQGFDTINLEGMMFMLICTPFITLKNGKKLFAHEKGKEAFCFEVTEEEHQKYMEKKKGTTKSDKAE